MTGEIDGQRAESGTSLSWVAFAALAGHIAQWSGTTHWQKQGTGTSVPYLWDCKGTVQTRGWRRFGAPGAQGAARQRCTRQQGLSI